MIYAQGIVVGGVDVWFQSWPINSSTPSSSSWTPLNLSCCYCVTFRPLSKLRCESEPNQRKVWMSFTFPHNQTNLHWQSSDKGGSVIQTDTRVQVAHLLNDKGPGLRHSPGDNRLQHTALLAAVSSHGGRLVPHTLYTYFHIGLFGQAVTISMVTQSERLFCRRVAHGRRPKVALFDL